MHALYQSASLVNTYVKYLNYLKNIEKFFSSYTIDSESDYKYDNVYYKSYIFKPINFSKHRHTLVRIIYDYDARKCSANTFKFVTTEQLKMNVEARFQSIRGYDCRVAEKLILSISFAEKEFPDEVFQQIADYNLSLYKDGI